MYIVQPIKETLCYLTVEEQDSKTNKITAVLATKDGEPLRNFGEPREVYLDSMSGTRVMRISNAEKEALFAAGQGDTVSQGQGEVHGWFVDAPDYTVNGAHGDKAKKEPAAA